MKLHASFEVFGSLCLCVWVCVGPYTAPEDSLGSGFECRTCDAPPCQTAPSSTALWTAPTTCLQDKFLRRAQTNQCQWAFDLSAETQLLLVLS